MSTEAETLLMNALVEGDDSNGPIKLTVNEKNRAIEYDGTLLLGVEDDDRSQKIHFSMPTSVGIDDLINIPSDNVEVFIIFKNALKETYKYQCTDVTPFDEHVEFSWLLSRSVTASKGIVEFIVCVQKLGTNEDGDPIIVSEWHTTPFEGNVLVGIDTDHTTPEIIVPGSTASVAKLRNEVDALSEKIDTTLAAYEFRIEDAIPGYSKTEIDNMFKAYLPKTGGIISGDLEVEGEISAPIMKPGSLRDTSNNEYFLPSQDKGGTLATRKWVESIIETTVVCDEVTVISATNLAVNQTTKVDIYVDAGETISYEKGDRIKVYLQSGSGNNYYPTGQAGVIDFELCEVPSYSLGTILVGRGSYMSTLSGQALIISAEFRSESATKYLLTISVYALTVPPASDNYSKSSVIMSSVERIRQNFN